MPDQGPSFTVKIADTAQELRAAQALRYQVFVRELGSDGPMVDHDAGLETDRFDPFFDHMIARDDRTGEVVGVYRLLQGARAQDAGGFYSQSEYDLTPLLRSGRRLLELGRSCLHKDYRGGTVMYHLWTALAAYVAQHEIEVLFGVASFHGTDSAALAQPLSLLHHSHLAPAELRPIARQQAAQSMDLVPADQIDRRAAMKQVPALIKAYLRLGGFVGQGAWIDHAFNTTDVCLVLDTARMNERQRKLYMKDTA